MWYVEEDQTVSGVFYPGQAGYIWLEDSNNVLRWEELGQTIDTDLFLTKTGLATGTGGATDNAMTQAAVTAAVNAKYTKPSTGIPKSDLASAVQTSLENADSAYQKPSAGIPKSDLASAVQTSLGLADTALQSVPSTSRTAAAQDTIDAGKADVLTEQTISTAGAVTQALTSGVLYHFTGELTSLTITLTAPASGVAHYHFDFLSGTTAPTLTMPSTVTMPDDFTVEASKRYEVDILNNYGAVISWANS